MAIFAQTLTLTVFIALLVFTQARVVHLDVSDEDDSFSMRVPQISHVDKLRLIDAVTKAKMPHMSELEEQRRGWAAREAMNFPKLGLEEAQRKWRQFVLDSSPHVMCYRYWSSTGLGDVHDAKRSSTVNPGEELCEEFRSHIEKMSSCPCPTKNCNGPDSRASGTSQGSRSQKRAGKIEGI